MVLDHALVAASDEDEVLDAGLPRFIDHVLDQRTIDHRQHFLRHRLRGGQEGRAEGGDGQYGFSNGFHDGIFGSGRWEDCRNGASFSVQFGRNDDTERRFAQKKAAERHLWWLPSSMTIPLAPFS